VGPTIRKRNASFSILIADPHRLTSASAIMKQWARIRSIAPEAYAPHYDASRPRAFQTVEQGPERCVAARRGCLIALPTLPSARGVRTTAGTGDGNGK
jgi:hypothetical protein